MLRAVVVDDEALARRRLCELVQAHGSLELVAEAADGRSALDVVAALRPDVLFLDIQMPELDGFQVLASLDEEDVPTVVFVTAYDEYALRAFDVGAHDYLLKPVTRERFEKAVARVLVRDARGEQARAARALAQHVDRERGHVTRLVARLARRHYFVQVADVIWLESEANYLRVHTVGGSHLVRQTMKEIEAKLDRAHFVRIHRSIMVAIDRIRSVQASEGGEYLVTMSDGARLTSSRSYSAYLRDLLR